MYNIIAYHPWGCMHRHCVLTCNVNTHSISPGPSGRASKQHLMVVLQKCRSMANGDTRDPKLICSLVGRAANTNTTYSVIHARESVMARFILCLQNQSAFIMVKNLLENWTSMKITVLDRPKWIVQAWNSQCSISFDTSNKQPVQVQDNFRCSQLLPGAQCQNASNKRKVIKGTMWSIICFILDQERLKLSVWLQNQSKKLDQMKANNQHLPSGIDLSTVNLLN